jgi:hypothetical protein
MITSVASLLTLIIITYSFSRSRIFVKRHLNWAFYLIFSLFILFSCSCEGNSPQQCTSSVSSPTHNRTRQFIPLPFTSLSCLRRKKVSFYLHNGRTRHDKHERREREWKFTVGKIFFLFFTSSTPSSSQ